MSRPLPFMVTGQLQEQGGAAVPDADAVPLTVWPARANTNSPQARTYTHTGEADLAWAVALQVPNRQLVVDGTTYKILSATPQPLLPHVALELRRVEGG